MSGKMRFFVFILLISIKFNLLFSQINEDVRISGNFKNIPLSALIDSLEKETNYHFYFNKEWFDTLFVSFNLNQTSLQLLLDRISESTPFTYKIIGFDKMIVFLPKEKVAIYTGKMTNASSSGNIGLTTIGNPADMGKYKKAKIKGKVIDGKNDEPLPGVNVYVENTSIGAISNSKGEFEFTLPTGFYNMILTSIGYEKTTYPVKVIGPGNVSFEIFEKTVNIDEITIYAQRSDKNIRGNQMSLIDIDSKTIKQLPSLVGTKDIIKSFTLMPGIKSVGEFGSGINVRGGGEDQNLYLIENVPIFNTSHVLGLLSVINPDAVTSVTLYKGQIPASYGERVSSVMDITLRDNSNNNTIHTRGGIGLYDCRIMVDGPANENTYFKVGARGSYSNWLLKLVPDANIQNSSAYFYDANALLNWKKKNDRVTLFTYYSNDYFRYSNKFAFNYGNILSSVNWYHFYNDRLSSSLVLGVSYYNAKKEYIENEFEHYSFSNDLLYSSVKYNLRYTGLEKHVFDAGIHSIRYDILPGKRSPTDDKSIITLVKIERERGMENALYLNDAWEISNKLSVNIGIRFSEYFTFGPKTIIKYSGDEVFSEELVVDTIKYKANKIIKNYGNYEPRISFKYLFNNQTSVKLSYNKNIQYLTLLSYSSISAPTDIWKLADTYRKPIIVHQYALGYYKNNHSHTIESSIEVYYKKMYNLNEFKNNAQIESNPNIERELIDAEGTNYGIEFLIKKNKGKLDGWICYTYSRSLRKTPSLKQEQINDGKIYPSSYDKPHDFTVVGTYHINKRLRFGFNFNYSTGRPVTLPEYSYIADGSNKVVIFSDRNKYRLPDYHRLDISISLDESLKISKRWKGSWTFSLINVYGHKNPYSVFYKKVTPSMENDYKMFAIYQLSIIGKPIPTLTYNFIF